MPALKNSKVYRGGVTAAHLSHETNQCSFEANWRTKTLDFRFSLASKGGGQTSVLFRVSLEDLETILQEVAKKFPDQVSFLTDCAAIANKLNAEKITSARADAEYLLEFLDRLSPSFGDDDQYSDFDCAKSFLYRI